MSLSKLGNILEDIFLSTISTIKHENSKGYLIYISLNITKRRKNHIRQKYVGSLKIIKIHYS